MPEEEAGQKACLGALESLLPEPAALPRLLKVPATGTLLPKPFPHPIPGRSDTRASWGLGLNPTQEQFGDQGDIWGADGLSWFQLG